MFYNLSNIWTEQIAEIATSLLHQFNTSSILLYNVSAIRLFKLQQLELAPTSPLISWNLLQEFSQYQYNNIAARLFLLKHSDMRVMPRCNKFLTNTITEGTKALITFLPNLFLRKHRAIMNKYNLIYQEQITSV